MTDKSHLENKTGRPQTLHEEFLVLSRCLMMYKKQLSTVAELSLRTVKECRGQVVVVAAHIYIYIYIHVLIHGVLTSLPERRVSEKMSQYTKQKTIWVILAVLTSVHTGRKVLQI
jgi:hypothetical protein